MNISPEIEIRELDRRIADGIEVALLWSAQMDGVLVTVVDTRSFESFELDVAAEDALDAFRHPFAYATRDHHELALAA